jgi:enoyl-CoA hydratase
VQGPGVTACHGYCVGGGIGLAGNSDILIAATGTKFALPEVDRGALGAATHLARLVPPLKMRAMVLTCEPASAEQLHAWGSVYAVVEPEELANKAREVARTFTQKIPRVVRVAKECLNNIDPVDVNRSYRFEQGFTFELNLAGVADEARDAFVEKRDPDAKQK